jgi:hypothetical protein
MIPPGDVRELRTAFASNPGDLGVGLYNPGTGEIRLGSFDRMTLGQGHQGLANAVGVANDDEWRGFLVRADGSLLPVSHFNLIDGSLALKPDHEARVRQALQQAGLVR